MAEKMSEYEFVTRAIKKLRKPPYKGIHSVYSGFNQAFREYFNSDPVTKTGAQKIEFLFDQRYQNLNGSARVGGQYLKLRAPKIEGERVSFSVLGKVRQDFSGVVKGDVIEGTVRTGEGATAVTTPWTATLVARLPAQHELGPANRGR